MLLQVKIITEHILRKAHLDYVYSFACIYLRVALKKRVKTECVFLYVSHSFQLLVKSELRTYIWMGIKIQPGVSALPTVSPAAADMGLRATVIQA